MTKYLRVGLAIVFILVALVGAQMAMGRSFFGPDGQFGLWTSSIWSDEQSQRLFDPYSFSHILHGLIFYLLLWIFCRRMPVRWRLVIAFGIEAGWEIVENTAFIINRYRSVTISLGYFGDSTLNSLGDMVMMAIGFFAAWKLRVWQSLVLLAIIEIVLLWWVRDNLTINIIMLTYPIEAIKQWQLLVTPMI